MKKFLGKLLRILFYVSYPILIVGLIVSLTLLVLKSRELDQVNATFGEATAQLNSENKDRQVTIDSLKQQFTDLNNEVATLKSENASLKNSLQKLQVEGSGTISGKVFPVVAADGKGFSQYQRVCAESVKNTSIQICRTVTSVQQSYNLNVPVGTYKIYTEVYPQPASGNQLSGAKAYYTEYAKCLQASDATSCDPNALKESIGVEVKAGSTINNIDPIDWRL